MEQQSIVHSHVFGRNVSALNVSAMSAQDQREFCEAYRELAVMGIALTPKFIQGQIQGLAMDDTQGLVTTPSIPNPVQFLQTFLPGLVRVLTAATNIDEFVGITTAGAWEDEEIIQGVLEPTGEAVPYGDYTNVPLSSWNLNFERRTVVRWEKGIKVGTLEEARAARVKINNAAEKRNAAALSLEILRNRIGFYGFNGGNNRTYGLLNDPSLPAYITAAATGTGSATTWASKSFLNITADIRGMFARLRAAAKDRVNPTKTATTLGLPTSVVDYLSVTSDFGVSVMDWLAKTYPKCRVVSAPELDAANGGANVAYLYADKVEDGGTDGGATFKQIVPAKFRTLGTAKDAKGYVEDYSNATAGIMVPRPFAVQRLTGI